MDLDNLDNEPIIPANFDEANQAAQAMFADDNLPPPEEQPPPGPPGIPEDNIAENTPEVPPENVPPVQPQGPNTEMLLQQAFYEMQALKAENERLQQAMTQQSEMQKQNVVEEALQMPSLDLAALAYDDEATIQQKQGQYAQDMAQYIQKIMMKEMSPFLEHAKEGLLQKQKGEVIAALSAIPDLQGINDMLPQLDNIMAKNKLFSSSDVPLDEKYIAAFMIANGINSRKSKGDDMTAEKFMQFYASNPELKDMVDKQRLSDIKGAQEVPVMSPSTGAVNAALNVPKKPENFDEAYELTKKFFNN